MISTYHNADTRSIFKRGKEVTKPSCVVDYNHNIGAIHLKVQLLNMYLVERKKNDQMVHEIIQTPTQLHSAEFYDSIHTTKGTKYLPCILPSAVS
jgi:hypothetical protein